MVNIENTFESPEKSGGLEIQKSPKNLEKSGNLENPEPVVSPLPRGLMGIPIE